MRSIHSLNSPIDALFSPIAEDAVAQGGQLDPRKKQPLSVSAVMVPTLGIFEGQLHATYDDWVNRYWDDGSSTLPILGWEGHDEGDTGPNADTSAWSGNGAFTKIIQRKKRLNILV